MDSSYSEFTFFSTQQSEYPSEISQSQYSTEISQLESDETPNTKPTTVRGASFTSEEDRLIVSAWLNTSVDAIHGNEQKSGTFWKRVEEFYHANKNNIQSDRSEKMLTQRWRKIQESVNKFCGCLANINARNESGKTEQTKIGDAKELYKTKYGSGFKLDHAWLLLRYQPKWMEMQENASTKTSAKKSKPSAGCSSSTPITPINIDQEDLNNNVQDQTVRPPGRKGEKRKSKQDNTEASTPVADLYQKIMDDKRQRDEQKMELLRQKIEQNERKEQLKRAELEMKIMSVDTSNMDDEIAADAVDDYVRIAETTATETLKRFVVAIINIFGEVYLRKLNKNDTSILLAEGERRGFSGMLGSIDCMHWKWKNCPAAWKGMYARGDHHEPTLILEIVASYDLWIWHQFFGLPGSHNDLNVLDRSPLNIQGPK